MDKARGSSVDILDSRALVDNTSLHLIEDNAYFDSCEMIRVWSRPRCLLGECLQISDFDCFLLSIIPRKGQPQGFMAVILFVIVCVFSCKTGPRRSDRVYCAWAFRAYWLCLYSVSSTHVLRTYKNSVSTIIMLSCLTSALLSELSAFLDHVAHTSLV